MPIVEMLAPSLISFELVSVIALNLVVAPIAASNVITPLPAFTVSDGEPLIVVVAPLNVMSAFVEVNVIACVDNVIGPVKV